MKTTQNTYEPMENLKDCFREGYAIDANGNTFAFQLWMSDRKTKRVVNLDIYREKAIQANRVDGMEYTALSVESARTAWARMWAKLTSEYSVISYTTSRTSWGRKEEEVTTWEAKPEGGIRQLIACFHDGNEGSYSVMCDFANMTLTSGGTCCPDIPREFDTVKVSGGPKELDAAFQAKVDQYVKCYIGGDVIAVSMNWVRTEWKAGAAQ